MSRLPRDDKFVSMQSLSGDRAANAPPSPVLSRPQDAPIAPPAQEGADEALAARSLKDERIDDAGSQAADSAMADDLAGAEPELLEAASGGAPTEALGPDDSADIAEPDLPEEIVHDKQSVEMIVSDGGDMPDSLAEPECVEPPNEIVAESVTQGSGVVTDASDTVPPDDGEPEPEEVVVEVPMADEDAVEIDAAATVMPVIESLAEETQTQAPQDVSQEESLAPPSVDRVSEPVSMVRGELVLGVVPSVERIKAGRRQMFNLVLTSHRLLLARITAPMLRAAAAQARESGIDLTGISGMSSLGNAVLCSRYASQAPDQILSTHDDNFGMSLASVRQIQIIEATDDDDSDVMIIHALREVAYTLPLGASEQARRTLRSVLGDDLVP